MIVSPGEWDAVEGALRAATEALVKAEPVRAGVGVVAAERGHCLLNEKSSKR